MLANLCTIDNTEIFSAEKGQSSSNSQYSLHHSQTTLQEHRHQTGSPERKNEKGGHYCYFGFPLVCPHHPSLSSILFPPLPPFLRPFLHTWQKKTLHLLLSSSYRKAVEFTAIFRPPSSATEHIWAGGVGVIVSRPFVGEVGLVPVLLQMSVILVQLGLPSYCGGERRGGGRRKREEEERRKEREVYEV